MSRGWCPACLYRFELRKDGRLRAHGFVAGIGQCRGSGQSPTDDPVIAAARAEGEAAGFARCLKAVAEILVPIECTTCAHCRCGGKEAAMKIRALKDKP